MAEGKAESTGEPPTNVHPSTMATVEEILEKAGKAGLIVAPVKPYQWSKAGPDIPFTKINAGLIGMTYVHEGIIPALMSDEDLKKLEVKATVPSPKAEDIAEFEASKVKKVISENYNKYANWYLVLVSCEQVRSLGQGNLDNFARMCKADPFPARASAFISYWAAVRAPLVSNANVRATYESNRFFEYHTTGSSTPLLCQQAVEEADGLPLFSEKEIAQVAKAVSTIHDLDEARKIPNFTLVKVRAVLEASATLPEIWYMGAKAVDRYSGKKYAAIVKHLKAIFAIQTRVDQLPDMSMATLVTSLDELLKSGKASSLDGDPTQGPPSST